MLTVLVVVVTLLCAVCYAGRTVGEMGSVTRRWTITTGVVIGMWLLGIGTPALLGVVMVVVVGDGLSVLAGLEAAALITAVALAAAAASTVRWLPTATQAAAGGQDRAVAIANATK